MYMEIWLLNEVRICEGRLEVKNIGIYSSIEKLKEYVNFSYFDESFVWYQLSATLYKGESADYLLTANYYILDELV